jgi:hypothetical protein
MIGLLDGDIVVFRCAFACERNVWHLFYGPQEDGGWESTESFDYKKDLDKRLDEVVPGKYSREQGVDYDIFPERQLEPLKYALHNVKTLIANILEECELDEYNLKVYLSPEESGSFRHRVATSAVYKGNRKDQHRPTYEKEIRGYIKANYDTYVAVDEEADDMLGKEAIRLGDKSILISLDKDLDMIPGKKFNWLHHVMYDVTPEQADRNFCVQVMSGDSTDNIPGLPKIGPGRAKKALASVSGYEDMMREVANMYMAKSPVEDWYSYLVEQGQLIWIRRKTDEMWQPPECVRSLKGWDDLTDEELTL